MNFGIKDPTYRILEGRLRKSFWLNVRSRRSTNCKTIFGLIYQLYGFIILEKTMFEISLADRISLGYR